MTSFPSAIPLLITIVFAATATGQSIINVPADQPTIQAGIDAAVNGDTVLVAPGTYTESNISFGGRAITVTSSGGPDVTTVRADCNDGARTFRFENGEGQDSVLQGFTITRRQPFSDCTDPDTPAGGVHISGASPTIADCKLLSNGRPSTGHPDGGAIFMTNSSAVLLGCVFELNSVGFSGFGPRLGRSGGAVFISNSVDVEVTNCEFVGNQTCDLFFTGGNGGHGGAMFVSSSSVVVTGCSFTSNSAGGGNSIGGTDFNEGWGGALYATDSTVEVTDCLFESNRPGRSDNQEGVGGAIANVGSAMTVTNSVFSKNLLSREPFGGLASAIFASNLDRDFVLIGPSTVSVTNSTFVNNRGAAIVEDGTSSISIRNSILWGNGGAIFGGSVTYSNIEGGSPGVGNIDVDPLLSADHHLLAGSPCIDAGDPNVAGLPATDFEGDARVVGSLVDMGADERRYGQAIAYGCGVNPPGSMSVLVGQPSIGTTVVFGLDNPLGTQTPGALALLVLSAGPDPNFPCGTVFPGFGMDGPLFNGEVLLDLTATAAPIQNSLWVGPGVPAPALLSIPDDTALIGATFNVQGVLVDLSPGAFPVIGLTDAMELVIGL